MIRNFTYLSDLRSELLKRWPDNRTINICCHGHSVPAGYAATPFVNTFGAYPHLLHKKIKERFPYAVVNIIVTAIGGENSESGAKRFDGDVLCHKPDLVTIDYGLNDRGIGLECAKMAWSQMIDSCLEHNIPVILLTPTWDDSFYTKSQGFDELCRHSEQIRHLADEKSVGLADSFRRFEEIAISEDRLPDLLSHVNHPSERGHAIVAEEIAKYFIAG